MLTLQAEPAEGSARDGLTPHALVARGWSRSRAGEVTAALADLDVAREAWSALDDLDRAVLLGAAIDCRLARGELAPASEDGATLRSLLDADGLAGATAHYACGELASATGETEAAAGHFAATGRLLDGADDPDRLPWRTEAALAAVRLGQRPEAVALAREHLALARAARAPYAIGLGLRTVATVDVRADAAHTLREARTALATTPASRLSAQIATDLAGVLLLSGGSESEAVSLLRPAEEYAGREQLYPLQGRIRRLLDRLGEPARPVLAEALAALTASEARVATLAAGGLTNREIARSLLVTVKAVEWHLSHVYRKLGIRSRAALATSLGVD